MLSVGKLYKTLERVSVIAAPGFREQIPQSLNHTRAWKIVQPETIMLLLGWEEQKGDSRNISVWFLYEEQIFLYLGAYKDFENGALWERII